MQASTSLYEILHLFESGRCHMAVLIDSGDAEAAISADEQLEEVIHVRVENEQIENQPILTKCPSAVTTAFLPDPFTPPDLTSLL